VRMKEDMRWKHVRVCARKVRNWKIWGNKVREFIKTGSKSPIESKTHMKLILVNINLNRRLSILEPRDIISQLLGIESVDGRERDERGWEFGRRGIKERGKERERVFG
jgi:hypothetical protein